MHPSLVSSPSTLVMFYSARRRQGCEFLSSDDAAGTHVRRLIVLPMLRRRRSRRGSILSAWHHAVIPRALLSSCSSICTMTSLLAKETLVRRVGWIGVARGTSPSSVPRPPSSGVPRLLPVDTDEKSSAVAGCAARGFPNPCSRRNESLPPASVRVTGGAEAGACGSFVTFPERVGAPHRGLDEHRSYYSTRDGPLWRTA